MILFSDKFLLSDKKIDDIRNRYKQDEYKITYENGCNIWSSYFEQDQFLKDVYEDKILQFLKHIPVSSSKGYIQDPDLSYWVQIYNGKSAGGHQVHDHWCPDCIISFVHFVKVPDQKCFYFKAEEKSYPKQDQGDIIFFPSWASHGVDPVTDYDDRIVLAGNISIKGFMTKASDNTCIRWKLTKGKDSFLWESTLLTYW
tara:strand:+ start:504 stop:1100 length:597 start_codon:yes stop_codon:yes gene_type:complete